MNTVNTQTADKHQKLDLVTICYWDDLHLLKIQAKSIARFFDDGLIETIIIIVNDNSFSRISHIFHDEILPLYGPLSAKVRLIHYSALYGEKVKSKKLGWKSQQVLKLLGSKTVSTENYMILDSKNHFVRPVSTEKIYSPEGKLYTPLYNINPKFLERFQNACAYFGYEGQSNLEKGMPSATPYMMKADVARALVQNIEDTENVPFQDFFMNNNFTEFYLCYAYMLAEYGGVSRFYEETWNPCVTLFAGFYGRPDVISEHIDYLLNREDVYCFGIHRVIWEKSSPDFLRQIKDIWATFSLIETGDNFAALIKPYSIWQYYLRRFTKHR